MGVTNIVQNDKVLPILLSRKEDCCGCSACYAICPKSAISIQPDEEGFDYPVVDASKCVSCYMCLQVCPIKAMKKAREKNKRNGK